MLLEGNGFVDKLPLIIALVLLVLLVLFYYLRKKKYNDQMDKMQKDLVKGQKIVTYSGIIGTIVEIKENEMGKYFVIQTGSKEKFSYVEVDSRSIYGPVESQKPAADKPKQVTEEKKVEIKDNIENKPKEKPEKTENSNPPVTAGKKPNTPKNKQTKK